MHKYQLILLFADPAARRTPAFERARYLAEKTGAALHICVAAYSRTIAAAGFLSRRGTDSARQGFMGECTQLLEQEASALRGQGLRVSTEAVWSSKPEEVILGLVEKLRPDLVVKDAHGGSALPGMHADADRILLRTCPAPLLLVHAETAGAPRRIAAAVDTDRERRSDAAFNNLIVHTAGYFGSLGGAEVHLLHAEPHLVLPGVPMRHGHPIKGRTAPPLPRSPFETFAELHHVPLDHCHRLAGATVDAVSEFVGGHHIDLLVLGTEPRPFLQRLRRGNKIERINYYSFCDVLALKPPRLWKREPAANATAALAAQARPGDRATG
ncbi:MAG: universal stress protein [Nevskia sp.]|nr:universal stress protein [Nevskia sp.]